MKKWKSMLSILVIVLVFSGVSHGVKSNIINVSSLNGNTYSVKKVPVIKDGQAIEVDYPSFVLGDRTLIPVRVAEELGAEVGWDHDTSTATVTYKDKVIELTIDSPIAIVNNEKVKLDKNSIPRLIVHIDKDRRTMVPLAFMSEMLGYDVDWDGELETAYINTRKEKPEEDKEEPEEELDKEEPEEELDKEEPEEELDKEEPEVESINRVKEITKETIEGKKAVVVNGTKNVEYNIIKLKNPERIVVDFLDSTLEGSTYYELKHELGFIKGVRVSQFVPDKNYGADDKVVRVVLDTKDGVFDPEVEIKKYGNKVAIFPEANLWENIFYKSGKDSTITINNLINTKYSVDYNATNKKMEIEIPANALDLLPGTLSINDDLVKDIKVVENSGKIKLSIQFKKNIEYNIMSKDIDNKIVVNVKEEVKINNNGKVIVIDPGHGGRDPGAIGNGIRETDINLTISRKVQKKLTDAGYKIIMTRDKDITMALSPRPALANNNSADLFISIHTNSFTNPSANGIETLYAPSSNAQIEKKQKTLSKGVQDNIIKQTGAVNRRVKQRPRLLVLRKAKMPAILVEVGFLSNPREAKLVSNSSYQDKIVNGIVKGVDEYFNKY